MNTLELIPLITSAQSPQEMLLRCGYEPVLGKPQLIRHRPCMTESQLEPKTHDRLCRHRENYEAWIDIQPIPGTGPGSLQWVKLLDGPWAGNRVKTIGGIRQNFFVPRYNGWYSLWAGFFNRTARYRFSSHPNYSG